MAYGDNGETFDLTDRVDDDGKLDWHGARRRMDALRRLPRLARQAWSSAPAPAARAMSSTTSAATALDAYLKKFDDAIGDRDIKSFRAFFNDSYEVDDASGNSDATPAIFAEFQRRRGYDLRDHLPALFDKASADENARVLVRLPRDDLGPAAGRVHQALDRVGPQARRDHAQPGARLAGEHPRPVRRQRHSRDRGDRPHPVHVGRERRPRHRQAARLGRGLHVARRALPRHARREQAVGRQLLPRRREPHLLPRHVLLAAEATRGRGGCSTRRSSCSRRTRSGRTFTALNDYVARCQSFLQAGSPDNDVLVYYPIHDEWARSGRTTLPHFNGEMRGKFGRQVAEELLAGGIRRSTSFPIGSSQNRRMRSTISSPSKVGDASYGRWSFRLQDDAARRSHCGFWQAIIVPRARRWSLPDDLPETHAGTGWPRNTSIQERTNRRKQFASGPARISQASGNGLTPTESQMTLAKAASLRSRSPAAVPRVHPPQTR